MRLLGKLIVFLVAYMCALSTQSVADQPRSISDLRNETSSIEEIVFLLKSAFASARCYNACNSIALPSFRDHYTFAIRTEAEKHSHKRAKYLSQMFRSKAEVLTPGIVFEDTSSGSTAEIEFQLVEITAPDRTYGTLKKCGSLITDKIYAGGTYKLYYYERQTDITDYSPAKDLTLITCATLTFDKVLDFREGKFLVGNDTPSKQHLLEILGKTTMQMRKKQNPSVSQFVSELISQFETFKQQNFL